MSPAEGCCASPRRPGLSLGLDGSLSRHARRAALRIRCLTVEWLYELCDRIDAPRIAAAEAIAILDRLPPGWFTVPWAPFAGVGALLLTAQLHMPYIPRHACWCGFISKTATWAQLREATMAIASAVGWHLHARTPLEFCVAGDVAALIGVTAPGESRARLWPAPGSAPHDALRGAFAVLDPLRLDPWWGWYAQRVPEMVAAAAVHESTKSARLQAALRALHGPEFAAVTAWVTATLRGVRAEGEAGGIERQTVIGRADARALIDGGCEQASLAAVGAALRLSPLLTCGPE